MVINVDNDPALLLRWIPTSLLNMQTDIKHMLDNLLEADIIKLADRLQYLFWVFFWLVWVLFRYYPRKVICHRIKYGNGKICRSHNMNQLLLKCRVCAVENMFDIIKHYIGIEIQVTANNVINSCFLYWKPVGKLSMRWLLCAQLDNLIEYCCSCLYSLLSS